VSKMITILTRHLSCRRTVIAVISIGCLTYLGIRGAAGVAESIAAVAIGLAASNAYQFRGSKREEATPADTETTP
jgi:hypothetical protein